MRVSPRFDANPAVLWAVLSPAQRDLLNAAAEAARFVGADAYLVGGPVRDLLLGATHLHDLDLTTTMDARVVAANFARRVHGVVEKTTEFGTATMTAPTADGSASLDFATTRTETYPRPGALPVTVFPAPTVPDDLKRRDFTINAMALPLMSASFGPLLDPFNGLNDLRAGLIRVLHDASFRDDPTRLYRGARYAARYHYTFEPHTAAFAETAIDDRYLSTISTARKRREIERGMRESHIAACFAVSDAQGLLQATSPAMVWNDRIAERIASLTITMRQHHTNEADVLALWPLWAAFVLHTGESATATMHRLFTDLAITETAVQAPIHLLARAFDAWQAGAITPETENSALALYFEKLPEWVVSIFFPPLAARLRAFYDRLQAYRAASHLDGNDLQLLGIPRGPFIGKVQTELRAAWLDERVETLEDEKGFVRNRITK